MYFNIITLSVALEKYFSELLTELYTSLAIKTI